MSAFMMQAHEIAPIVEFAIQHKVAFVDGGGNRIATRENANRLGQIFTDANQKSVNFRYRETEKAPRYIHVKPAVHSTFLDNVADAISCLDYQACEPPDWTTTEAHAILARLNMIMVRVLKDRSPL